MESEIWNTLHCLRNANSRYWQWNKVKKRDIQGKRRELQSPEDHHEGSYLKAQKLPNMKHWESITANLGQHFENNEILNTTKEKDYLHHCQAHMFLINHSRTKQLVTTTKGKMLYVWKKKKPRESYAIFKRKLK